MLENIEVLYHSCIKFNFENTIYVDPFGIKKDYNDADIILITHSHFDHFSDEDIRKVKNDNTLILAPEEVYDKLLNMNFKKENITIVEPNKNYCIKDIEMQTVPAYNVNKKFHPKENNWVGYLINYQNIIYYVAGDTDMNQDNEKVKCDVAFVPVGGTYTMSSIEAAEFVNLIKPKIAVPIHYGSIVGNKTDAETFINNLQKDISGTILM